MKVFKCELWEDQTLKYHTKVEAENKEDAEEKVLANAVQRMEVLEIKEVKED